MALPAAVKKQASEADALHSKIYGVEDPETTEVTDDTETPEISEADGSPPSPTPEPVADEAQEIAGRQSPEPKDEPWEQRYSSLKGRFDADTRTMRSQIEGLTEQVRSLNAALAQAQPAAPETPSEVAAAASRLLSDAEVEEYGEELIDVVQRAAKEVFQPTIDKLSEENTQLKNQMGMVSSSVAKSKRQTLFDGLDERVKGWRDTNTSPEYLQWLQEPDLYSGERRHVLLNQAFENNDLARVAAFFEGYRTETAVLDTAGQPEAQPARSPQVRMDTLVAPGTPRGGSTPGQERGKRRWTQAQIAEFYRNKTNGVYRSEAAGKRAAALEADIFAAQREGRITP